MKVDRSKLKKTPTEAVSMLRHLYPLILSVMYVLAFYSYGQEYHNVIVIWLAAYSRSLRSAYLNCFPVTPASLVIPEELMNLSRARESCYIILNDCFYKNVTCVHITGFSDTCIA